MVVKSMLLASAVVALAIFLSMFVDMQPYATPNYQILLEECDEQLNEEYRACCVASVEAMERLRAFPIDGSDCPVHFTFNSQQCLGSFQWCEPESLR